MVIFLNLEDSKPAISVLWYKIFLPNQTVLFIGLEQLSLHFQVKDVKFLPISKVKKLFPMGFFKSFFYF